MTSSNGLKPVVSKEKLIEEIFDLFNGDIRWEYQCPPEQAGAMIALLHCLGAGWERAKTITLNCATESDLLTSIGLLTEVKAKKRNRNSSP